MNQWNLDVDSNSILGAITVLFRTHLSVYSCLCIGEPNPVLSCGDTAWLDRTLLTIGVCPFFPRSGARDAGARGHSLCQNRPDGASRW